MARLVLMMAYDKPFTSWQCEKKHFHSVYKNTTVAVTVGKMQCLRWCRQCGSNEWNNVSREENPERPHHVIWLSLQSGSVVVTAYFCVECRVASSWYYFVNFCCAQMYYYTVPRMPMRSPSALASRSSHCARRRTYTDPTGYTTASRAGDI